MQHLEVSCAVRRLFKSLSFKGLTLRYFEYRRQAIFLQSKGVEFFQKPRSHLRFRGTRRAIRLQVPHRGHTPILRVTFQNVITNANWSTGFVHP